VYVFWDWLKHLVGEYTFQPPIRKKAEQVKLISETHDVGLGEVSEHILKHIQSVVEELGKVSAGAYVCSVKQIFNRILADNTFSVWSQGEPLFIQFTKLYNWQLDEAFNGVGKLKVKIKSINAQNISDIYNETRNLVFNFRSSVNDLIQLLNNLEKEGAPTVWNNEPLSGQIYRELRDNYDELMQRVKNLKVYVPEASKSLLPYDEQLTKFDRIPGVINL
jgi:hypothetical protein